MKDIIKDNRLIKFIYFLVGIFGAAFTYNLIFAKTNTIVGGVSGLAIIIKELFGIKTTVFICITNIFLIIIGFIFLGKKGVIPQLFGSIAFPMMISISEPITNLINLDMISKTSLIIFGAIMYGISTGIVYRVGYSTGGSDILSEIISIKFKISITNVSGIILLTIILTGCFVFKIEMILYAILVILISNAIANHVLFGISFNKIVYVLSEKNEEIENYIMDEIKTGATEIKVKNRIFRKKKQMLLCVINSLKYKKFKEDILKMDKNAILLVNRCYELTGGKNYNILPF